MSAEFTLEDVANVIKPLVEQVNALNEELSAVKASFNAFKEEPAAGRITSASVAKNEGEGAASKRLEFLASLRNKKK
jgi:pantothenate kinase